VLQVKIIEACNKVLLDKIVSKVNPSKYFSILADETADVSRVDQVSCVRYVEMKHLELHEEFLQFVPILNVTGKRIETNY